MRQRLITTVLFSVIAIQAATAQDRFPGIPEDKYTEQQTKAAQEFLATRKKAVFGPFVPLIRSPQLMIRAKEMGDYLRFNSSLP